MFSGGNPGGYQLPLISPTTAAMSAEATIDWAQLAQKWIQMHENPAESVDMGTFVPTAPPPPNISGNNYTTSNDVVHKTTLTTAPAKKGTFEEKGEADMDMDDEDDGAASSGISGRVSHSRDSPPPPAPSMRLNRDDFNIMQFQKQQIEQPWFMQQMQTQMKQKPSAMQHAHAPSGVGYGLNTDIAPPAPTWSNWSGPPAAAVPQTVMHLTAAAATTTARIPSLLKLNVPNPTNQAGISAEESDNIHIEAAKRKMLPAWLREGLEKMEREKQKQTEKRQELTKDKLNLLPEQHTAEHKQALLYQDKESMVKKTKMASHLASDDSSGNEEEEDKAVDAIEQQVDDNENDIDGKPLDGKLPTALLRQKTVNSGGKSEDTANSSDSDASANSDIDENTGKSYENKLDDLMVAVRRTITEILLEVTNEEIARLAQETLESRKKKASSAQVIRKSALSSITGKLGLTAYGSDSSSDGDSSADEASTANDTDSEEEIQNSLRQKKRAFVKISEEIEDEIAKSAAREEEKLKYYAKLEQEKEEENRTRKQSEQNELDGKEVSDSAAADFGKVYGRELGETTTDTKSKQHSNGKRQKDWSSRKERTTRFTDNKDSKVSSFIASNSAAGNASYLPQQMQVVAATTKTLGKIGSTSSTKPTLIFNPTTSLYRVATSSGKDVNGLYTAAEEETSSSAVNSMTSAADAALSKAMRSSSKSSSLVGEKRHRRNSSEDRYHERNRDHRHRRRHHRKHSSDDETTSQSNDSDSTTSTLSSKRSKRSSRESSSQHYHKSSSRHQRHRERYSSDRHSRSRHHRHHSSDSDEHSRRRRSRSTSKKSQSSSSSTRHRH